MRVENCKLGTQCIQGGWDPKKGEARVLPIYQSTTFLYESSEQMGRLFDLEDEGFFYTRLQNPTSDAVAAKIAALEGGVGAMLTASGQAANFYAVFNICEAGDHFICSSNVYGGTFNLFGVTMKKLGIECTFVDPDDTEENLAKAFRPNTKCVVAETIANPALTILDIEKFARLAHSHGVPLIIDNTFATPINCRPFEWGADIVTHSSTKYLGGHNDTISGIVVIKDNEELVNKVRVHIKSHGSQLSPMDSWLVLRGIKTLAIRMDKHSENAYKVAHWLRTQEKVKKVYYVGFEDHRDYEITKKQTTGFGGMISFSVDEFATVKKILKNVDLVMFAESLGGTETLITYPTTQTHEDTPQEMKDALGIDDCFLRLSVGIENADDIIADLDRAMNG